jgi:hypothetical protein
MWDETTLLPEKRGGEPQPQAVALLGSFIMGNQPDLISINYHHRLPLPQPPIPNPQAL